MTPDPITYYVGPTSDVDEHGIPEVSINTSVSRTNMMRESGPELGILTTVEGTDISGTFLTGWTAYDFDGIKTLTNDDPAWGYPEEDYE